MLSQLRLRPYPEYRMNISLIYEDLFKLPISKSLTYNKKYLNSHPLPLTQILTIDLLILVSILTPYIAAFCHLIQMVLLQTGTPVVSGALMFCGNDVTSRALLQMLTQKEQGSK